MSAEVAATSARPTAESTAAALRHLADLADAREDAKKEGYAQGLAEGRQAAARAGEEELARLRQRFGSLAASLQRNLRESEEAIADELLALALDLAQAMTRATLAIKPDIVKGIIAACVHEMPTGDAEIRLHPDDVALANLGDLSNSRIKLVVTPDPSLERGECVSASAAAVADGRHRTRWNQLMLALSTDHAWLAND